MEKQDRFVPIENLLRILDEPLVIFDVGVRWGFQEHWKRLEPLVTLIGVDADEQEIDELKKSTKDELIPKVFGARNGNGWLYLTENPACSSLYSPDENLICIRPGMRDTTPVSSREVEISTLDEWTKKKGVSKVDFIKLDVQGAELDILQGSEEILQSVRALEVEVQFNPLYQNVPLFGDVDRFLRQRGFSLWRIRNFSHYHIAGTNRESTTEEIINYDAFPVRFNGRGGQLFWADAFYVRNETAYELVRPWQTTLKDACIAGILGFDDLFIATVRKALKSCPEEIAQKVKVFFTSEDVSWLKNYPKESIPIDQTGMDYELIDMRTLQELKSNLQELERSVQQLKRERDQSLVQVNALYNSHSYRVTAPLRATLDFFRRLLGKI